MIIINSCSFLECEIFNVSQPDLLVMRAEWSTTPPNQVMRGVVFPPSLKGFMVWNVNYTISSSVNTHLHLIPGTTRWCRSPRRGRKLWSTAGINSTAWQLWRTKPNGTLQSFSGTFLSGLACTEKVKHQFIHQQVVSSYSWTPLNREKVTYIFFKNPSLGNRRITGVGLFCRRKVEMEQRVFQIQELGVQ